MLLVVVICYVGEFFLNARGPIILLKYVYMLFFSTIMVGAGIKKIPGIY